MSCKTADSAIFVFSTLFHLITSTCSLLTDSKLMCVFISNAKGEELSRSLSRLNESIDIRITISPNTTFYCRYSNVNRTSVLFVSVSFILLMFISLTWLIVYYVQRFRDLQAKDILTVSTFVSMVIFIMVSQQLIVNICIFFSFSLFFSFSETSLCRSKESTGKDSDKNIKIIRFAWFQLVNQWHRM